jgi:membrane-associated phospholipid phosphatase
MRRVVVVALALALPGRPAPAQTTPSVRAHLTWWDVATVPLGAVVYMSPNRLGMPRAKPACVPCDPATLLGIDRWALRPVSNLADVGSDAALYFVAAWTAVAGLGGRPPQEWQGNFATFANTAIWTAAVSEWTKVLVRRSRPVMYTSSAQAATRIRSSQLSMPSGHAAIAFATATTYLVLSGREHLPHRGRNVVILYGAALSVGSLRVAAGKHFPTDIIVGGLLGSAIGWLVPAVHPTTSQP